MQERDERGEQRESVLAHVALMRDLADVEHGEREQRQRGDREQARIARAQPRGGGEAAGHVEAAAPAGGEAAGHRESAEQAGGEAAEHGELRPLGIDVEAWPFVAAAAALSLALAAAAWLRPGDARLLAVAALALLAALLALLRVAAAAIAASMARSVGGSPRPARLTAPR